ncbi:MAG TPA: DUF5668 domain-containing protein [Candidatus Aminicenantes bacterium]|nr:DUF5668 domain-containing protein [Candidatus Aminicenantes bacterium]
MDEKTVVPQRPVKSPGLAGFLSAILPFGAGALYNEQRNKALTQFFIFAGLVYALSRGGNGVVFGLALAAFYFYQIFDNVQAARALNAAGAGRGPAAGAATEPPGDAPTGSIFWGLFLIVLGIVLVLANFEAIPYKALFDLWPVAVIVIGLKLVFEARPKSKVNR